MDLLNELDKLISRDNDSVSSSDGVIPLDVLLRQPPQGSNVTSLEAEGQFVRSVPEVAAILVAYSIVIILSLFGNTLVSISPLDTFSNFSANAKRNVKRKTLHLHLCWPVFPVCSASFYKQNCCFFPSYPRI